MHQLKPSSTTQTIRSRKLNGMRLGLIKNHIARYSFRRDIKTTSIMTIAEPESYGDIESELNRSALLGKTRDQHKIYLCTYTQCPCTMREIGRLREISFRKVGEGTGKDRDLDKYDTYYLHLVLWDEANQSIAGAYRLSEVGTILRERNIKGLYTSELFKYQTKAKPVLAQSLELGRSFVQPRYWGRASLDYLWQGLGAYLQHNSHIRYLIGPVSMSDSYPEVFKSLLVCYYRKYYGAPPVEFGKKPLAKGRRRYIIDKNEQALFEQLFADLDKEQAFTAIQQQFISAGYKIPVLFKQYSALYEQGGYHLLDFSVDANFENCLDGLFIADLSKMKQRKRDRYITRV